MLQNYLLSTLHLFLFSLICLLTFSACEPKVDIQPLMELTIQDKRNIADGIFDLISANDNYEILDRNEYADAYQHLDQYVTTITSSDLLTHRTAYKWTAHIINNEQGTNAFVTPGGYAYFDLGLLRKIDSEDAFMHLLAHTINYADKDIINQKLQDNYGLQLLLDLALDSNIETVEELLNTLYSLKYDLNDVEASDDFMLELACEKGYDASLLRWFLLNNSDITWLDLHPTNSLDTRLNFIRDYQCTPTNQQNITDSYQEFLGKL